MKEEQEEREKAKRENAKKLTRKQELYKARERVRRLREENSKLETELSLWERQTDQKFTSAATRSYGGRPNPGKADWGSRLRIRNCTSGNDNKPSGPLRRGNAEILGCGGAGSFSWGTCVKSAPHTNNTKLREMMVKHICKICFQKDGNEHAHGDKDPVCPHTVWLEAGDGGGGWGQLCIFRATVPSGLIQVQGDWASDDYFQYLSIPLGP